MRLASDSEAGGRLLSVVCSIATIAATYALTARFFDRLTGVVAAAVLAVSPFQIEFAQEARMYAMLALLATLSTTCLVRMMERWQVGWCIAYVVMTSLLTYTHIYGSFVLAAHALTIAWLFAADRPLFTRLVRPWIAAIFIVIVLFAPWMSILAAQTRHVQAGFWIPREPWIAILLPLWTYAGSTGAATVLVVTAAIGAFLAGGKPPSESGRPAPIVVLLPWLAGPIVLPFVLSRIGSPIFLPKYTIAAAVPFAMLAARGMTALPLARKSLATGFVAATAVLSGLALQTYYGAPRKDGWREAAAQVDAAARPGDVVYLYRDFNRLPFDYYLRRHDLDERPFVFDTTSATAETLAPILAQATAGRDRVWLVTLSYEPARPVIEGALRVTYDETTHLEAHDIDMFLFERRK